MSSTEQLLPDELALLRALVDAVPDPIFCKDLQGRYVFANRADADRWDTKEGGLIGRTVFEVPGLCEHADLYHADDLKVMETGEPMLNREEPFVDREGNPGWYLTSKFPLRGADGAIVGLVGIARDITERKQVERRLADERQLLQTVLDAIPDPVFFKDCQGRHVLFNRANEEMFDLRDDNYLGKTPLERAIPREFAEAYMRDDQQVLETGKAIVNREEPYQDRHGRRGWFLTSKFPLSDAAGQPIGLVGICRDITERKEADRKIKEERTFLKTLMDAIPDVIFFKDREGRHLHINAADRKVFGVEEGVHLGKTVFEWPIPPEIAAQYAADDRHVIETGEAIVNREEPFARADGSRGWFLTSKLPIHSAEGEVTGIVGIARDITQLKLDREELERTRSRLIDHVENSPLAVIEWRDGFYFDRWAGQAEAMFGWTAGEVLGKSVNDLPFVHPDELEAATARAKRLVDGLEDRNISNHRNLTKDGRTIHCVWHNSVLRDAQGKMVSVLS
ncbi:MAG: PAS domain-containing protein, partial [Chthoniobacteraceae bacterium]